MQARMELEQERTDEAASTVARGLGFLDGLPADETASVRAELEAIRAEIARLPRPEDVRAVRAAGGTLKLVRTQLADRQLYGVEESLRAVAASLAELPPAITVEQTAELAALRAELARIAPPPVSALTEDERVAESRAKTRLLQARALLESRQNDRIAGVLDEATGFIAQLPAAARPPLDAEIAAIRTEAGGAMSAEALERLTDELDRRLRDADESVATDLHRARETIERVERRLGEDDARAALAPAAVEVYRTRCTALRTRVAAAIKAAALARVAPVAAELEALGAGDPFAGKTQPEAYAVTSEIETLKNRIREALDAVPADDPDAMAIEARIRAVDHRIEEASAAWGKAQLDGMVVKT